MRHENHASDEASVNLIVAASFRPRLGTVLICLLYFYCVSSAFASDGPELAQAVGKVEALLKGNFGKLAALICVAAGALAAALRKEWTWLVGSVVLALGLNALVAMVNASFTATI